MAGTRPTVETVTDRCDSPRPCGAGVEQRVERLAHAGVVGQRLPHAHEDDVGQPARAAGRCSPFAIAAAAATAWPMISAAERLRVRPCWPVAQNGQAMPQPAWLEMQTVARSG